MVQRMQSGWLTAVTDRWDGRSVTEIVSSAAGKGSDAAGEWATKKRGGHSAGVGPADYLRIVQTGQASAV